jgi:hypothetical protein
MAGKKDIQINLDDIILYDYDIDGLSVDKITDKLNEIKNLYKKEYKDITMRIYSYYGEIEFHFQGIREENDEEYERRIAYEKHWENMKELEKSHKKDEDRKNFEKLRKQYGW